MEPTRDTRRRYRRRPVVLQYALAVAEDLGRAVTRARWAKARRRHRVALVEHERQRYAEQVRADAARDAAVRTVAAMAVEAAARRGQR